jgi:hypothetical protein
MQLSSSQQTQRRAQDQEKSDLNEEGKVTPSLELAASIAREHE